jgi:hypothetical protein
MSIRDQQIDPTSGTAKKFVVIPITTAISQTGLVAFSLLIGFKFEVTRIRTYCAAKAGTVSGNAKIGGRTAAPLVFTAATEVAAVLSTTKANVRGSATEVLTLEYTTDGSGVLTNGFVVVELRPRPMARDLGPT